MLGTAGAFVFLTYLTLPILVAVRSRSGAPARSILDGERERSVLRRLVGLDDDPGWRGGIRNGLVRRLAIDLGDRHRRFTSMERDYLDVIGVTIALAPLRTRDPRNAALTEQDRSAYWRYMAHTMRLLGAQFGPEPAATTRCQVFVDLHAGTCPDGVRLFNALNHHHPAHVHAAIPALFDGSRATVRLFAAAGPA